MNIELLAVHNEVFRCSHYFCFTILWWQQFH